MHNLLDEAEDAWREEVKTDFPLRADTPVVRKTTGEGRDWLFHTDLKTIYATIVNDEKLQTKFRELVTKHWDGEPEGLAREVLHYLLFHELYHPLEAPFSVSGPDNDNKRIHQAMRRGIVQAQPKLSSLEQIMKVHAAQNGVKDFILDNRFYVDNSVHNYVRQDVIPIWDFLELQESPAKTNFYTATRLLYGLLYGPQNAHLFFEEKSGKDGQKLAQEALTAILQKPTTLPKYKGVVTRLKSLVSDPNAEASKQLRNYPRAIRAVFSGEDRYNGIERFMTVLGPYVEQGMPQGRPDMQGAGVGASLQSILEDLLDDMNPAEQLQFTQGLAGLKPKALAQAAEHMPTSELTGEESQPNQVQNLDVLAAHEFYKRNHPKVTILGGRKEGESVVVGRRQYWDLKRSKVLTTDQLGRINLQALGALQRRTRLPWLIDLGNGTYRLNEYEIEERDIKDVVYVDKHLDVPDVTEFYLDSSGSMFGGTEGEFSLNDGGRWDMLSHVTYGFADALRQGAQLVGKRSYVRFHNFADRHVDSALMPIDQFWDGDIGASTVLFRPENGYSQEDLDITVERDGKKRAYIVATDGQLVISGRTEREAGKMIRLAKNPRNSVILFEIGGTYSLGEAVKSHPGISYYQVHNKNEMLAAGLEVLLSR